MYEYEQEAYAQGFRAVCGVDEARWRATFTQRR